MAQKVARFGACHMCAKICTFFCLLPLFKGEEKVGGVKNEWEGPPSVFNTFFTTKISPNFSTNA